MSESSREFRPPTRVEVFASTLDEFRTASQETADRIFDVLSTLAVDAILTESQYGCPPDSEVSSISKELHQHVFHKEFDELARQRLIGVYSMVYAAGTRLFPRLTEERYVSLSTLQNYFELPQGVLSAVNLSDHIRDGFVTVQWLGPEHERKCYVHVTPRGRAAMRAHTLYKDDQLGYHILGNES